MAALPDDPKKLETMLGKAGLNTDADELNGDSGDDPGWLARQEANPNGSFGALRTPVGIKYDDYEAQNAIAKQQARFAAQDAARGVSPYLPQSMQQHPAPMVAPPPDSPQPVPAPPPQGDMVYAKQKPPPSTAPGFAPVGGGGAGPSRGQAGANYLSSLRAQVPAMGNVGNAEAQIPENEGVAAGLRGQQMGADQGDQATDVADFKADIGKKMQAIDEASREAKDAKVDPDRWASDNPVRMVGMAIAAGFQGFSNGLRGVAGNHVLDQINNQINRDIASQEKDIEGKKGRVGDLKGELDLMYRRFGDIQQAKAAMRVSKYQQLDQEAQQYGATARSDVVRARAELLQKQFQSEIAKSALELIPKGSGPNVQAAIVKRAQELRDKAAGNGIDMPIDEARNQATAEVLGIKGYGGQGYAKGEEVGQGAGMDAAPPPALSYGERVENWLADAGVPGLKNTDAYRKKLTQEEANIPALQAIHKGGVRNVEAQKEIGAPILYNSSDDAATRAYKSDLRKRYAAGSKGGGDKPMPDDFEEDDR